MFYINQKKVKEAMEKLPDLKKTAEMMSSPDYKERFKAEYYQLYIRYYKLLSMVLSWDAGTLQFTPTCPRSTYDEQLKYMEGYMNVLEARAKMESIGL